ncbi:MAG: hypothetical protein NT038_09515 [Euryarchaeota archaeon]|nr:hypothetical protein [Euryarchaeota archaeon]
MIEWRVPASRIVAGAATPINACPCSPGPSVIVPLFVNVSGYPVSL